MICPHCRTPVPEGLLVCPGCALRKSDAALRQFQLYPLSKVAAGSGGLITRAGRGHKHIQMYGSPNAFCGQPVDTGYRRSLIYIQDQTDLQKLQGYCARCLEQVTEIMAEAVARCSD